MPFNPHSVEALARAQRVLGEAMDALARRVDELERKSREVPA